MINGKRIAVVLPAYNAEKTLAATVAELPELVDIRILVDDHSSDRTVEIAERLGLQFFVHDQNYGYGRNQQTCYREALAAGADVVIMVHPDYQYTPLLVTAMASMVAYDVYDVVLGSRIIGGQALHGGMPFYKYVANRFLTAFENMFLAIKLSEYHTGYRAFQPQSPARTSSAGELGRLCLRQPDAGAMREFWLPHWRGVVPDQVFRGSVVHQFPSQRDLRTGRALDDTAVCAAKRRGWRIFGFSVRKAESWKPSRPATTRQVEWNQIRRCNRDPKRPSRDTLPSVQCRRARPASAGSCVAASHGRDARALH